MALFKNPGSPDLQQLINSYNDEIMRYSRMAQPADERQRGEQQRESGEEAIERGTTERRYWQAEGKQGLQNGISDERTLGEQRRESGEEAIERGATEHRYWQAEGKQGLQRRPEPNEPLYAPGSHMPRPEPDEPLERPEQIKKGGGTTLPPFRPPLHAQKPPLAPPSPPNAPSGLPSAPPAHIPPHEPWIEELRQGLLDLERGLHELAQGEQQLREGLKAYRKGLEAMGHKPQMPPHTNSGTASPPPPPLSDTPNPLPPPPAAHNSRPNDAAPPLFFNLPSQGANTSMETAANNMPIPQPPASPAAQSEQSIPSDGMGTGYLQAVVFTARRAAPIAGAQVTVFSSAESGDMLYSSVQTDDDGKTPLIPLPVGTFSGGGYAAPFASYSVSVTAEGYSPRNNLPAQIFDGITAFLPVEMVPLPDTAPMIM